MGNVVIESVVDTACSVDADEDADVNGLLVRINVRNSEEVWIFGVSLVEYGLIGVSVVSGSGGEDVELILAAVMGVTKAL